MKKFAGSLFLLVLALMIPVLIKQNYFLRIFVMMFYFGIAAYAWDVIGGYAGQISLGQAVFFSIGAYSVAILYVAFNINVITGIVLGTIFSGLFAFLIGSIVLRLKGPYFTLSTLALAEVVRIILLHYKSFTGGAEGIFLPFKGGVISSLQFRGNLPYYYIGLFLLVIAILVNSYIRNSRLGYKLASLRNNEDASESIGINLMRTKVTAYVVSAILTALAGGFYMILDRYADPTSVGGVDLSVEILLIVLVGGKKIEMGPSPWSRRIDSFN